MGPWRLVLAASLSVSLLGAGHRVLSRSRLPGVRVDHRRLGMAGASRAIGLNLRRLSVPSVWFLAYLAVVAVDRHRPDGWDGRTSQRIVDALMRAGRAGVVA